MICPPPISFALSVANLPAAHVLQEEAPSAGAANPTGHGEHTFEELASYSADDRPAAHFAHAQLIVHRGAPTAEMQFEPKLPGVHPE